MSTCKDDRSTQIPSELLTYLWSYLLYSTPYTLCGPPQLTLQLCRYDHCTQFRIRPTKLDAEFIEVNSGRSMHNHAISYRFAGLGSTNRREFYKQPLQRGVAWSLKHRRIIRSTNWTSPYFTYWPIIIDEIADLNKM